jgi:putative endonuclease
MRKDSYIYILASDRNGTLYVGVTSDLVKRISEHKSKQVKGFSKKYNVTTLVYYEVHAGIEEAIIREKAIKAWKRKWKLELIEKNNPQWKGLYEEICG